MSDPVRLPPAEFAPDLPVFPGASSHVIRNVYPKTALSYGPVGGPAPLYGALNDRCIGAASYIDNNGDTTLFAGTTSKLYILKPGGAGWVDATNPSQLYDADRWRFTVFNGDVIAASRGVPTQYISLVSGTQFANLPDNPPRGRYVEVVKNAFVMMGDTFDPNDSSSWDDRLQWCAAGNHTDWPVSGTTEAAEKQSGSVRLRGPAGRIMGIAAGLSAADALIYQRFGVQRLLYSGPPTTFSLSPSESGRGCMAPDSIVVQNGISYYWSDDGVFAFNGQDGRPIGANKIDKTIYADLGADAPARIIGTQDPKRQLIIWAYPSVSSPDGNPDRLLFYSPPLDRFSLCEVSCEMIAKFLSVGYTLEELESVLGYDTLEELPYPLNSDVWRRGLPNIGIFDADHTLNFLDSTPLPATIDTPEGQLSAGRRQFITAVRPLVEGNVTPAVSVSRRERMQDAVNWVGPSTLNSMGVCPTRVSGRYVRVRTQIPSSAGWSEFSGVEIEPVRQGRR